MTSWLATPRSLLTIRGGWWLTVFPAMFLNCLAGGCATDDPSHPPDEIRVVIGEPWTPPVFAKPDELLVIVARKISLVEIDMELESGHVLMDSAFLARYQVLQTLVGDYECDEIEFLAFDHYGYPDFGRYDVVLLPIQLYGEEYSHVKYAFEPLRKFRGRWMDPKGRSIHRRVEEWARELGPDSTLGNGR